MRALLLVLDSVGIGGAPDAAAYGDEGANTLGHLFEQSPELKLPNLDSLGLPALLQNENARAFYRASYGRMRERSAGKDTTTGHWEIAGAVLSEPFAVFERFPGELVRAIERKADVRFLGNYASSGTTILQELGAAHVRTGSPILYTSADSVLQIAAHEKVIPLERLYEICRIARQHADAFFIGRVIARPFTGDEGKYVRTSGRHDYSMKPPRTILDALQEHGVRVLGIGKISDIFAGAGITESIATASNAEGMARISERWRDEGEFLIFANLVDFDMLFGHRRDLSGYARALEEFDCWLGQFLEQIEVDDLVIITADHGNDPSFRGTDHTREEVPLFVLHQAEARQLGTRETFADIAATLADFFGLTNGWPIGSSVLNSANARPLAH